VVTPPPVEVLELPEEAVCVAAAMSDGLTVAGFATTLSVLTALLMSISVWRSCSSSATELFCGSASMASARLLAPVPRGVIT
jgi:hypothetical protein